LKNFYTLLSVAPDAPDDEIKKAFRREIARYHPDKVQHLGQEFQQMASGIAADLTEAYRILMDPDLRARYDEDLSGGAAAEPGTRPAPRPPAQADPQAPPRAESSPSSSSSPFGTPPPPRPPSTAGIEFVKKASLSRLKDAMDTVFGAVEPAQIGGFDIAVTTKPKRGLFKKADDSLRVLTRFVPLVDGDAIGDVWSSALKARTPDAILCVLLVGPGMAPSKDLSSAISEQRRKSRNAGPVLVPVDVRDWEALFPPDTPAPVRALIQRLRDEKR
jgi:curved DNA-binding protein CbpA